MIDEKKDFRIQILKQCVDIDVGFFEAWVSVFDEVLFWKSRLTTLATTGESDSGSAGRNQARNNLWLWCVPRSGCHSSDWCELKCDCCDFEPKVHAFH